MRKKLKKYKFNWIKFQKLLKRLERRFWFHVVKKEKEGKVFGKDFV